MTEEAGPRDGAPTQETKINTKSTIASTIAALLDNDGSRWRTEEGRTLCDLAAEIGCREFCEEHDDREIVPHRILFADGSAIAYGEAGWDIEGSRPFLMAGLDNR